MNVLPNIFLSFYLKSIIPRIGYYCSCTLRIKHEINSYHGGRHGLARVSLPVSRHS